jgi:hypothetical protein
MPVNRRADLTPIGSASQLVVLACAILEIPDHDSTPIDNPGNLGGERSTPHFHFEAGHVREMLEIVRDHDHPLGDRV